MTFKYHQPVPDAYNVANPTNPLTEISKTDLKALKKLAKKSGASGFSYAKLSDEFKEEWNIDYDNVIIVKYVVSDDILKMEQSPQKAKLMDDEFQDIGDAIFEMADYLRELGFKADVIHPLDDEVSLRAVAMQSNDCAILRSNMCLFKDGLVTGFFPIATSIENLPFKEENTMLWVADYCKDCGKCIRKCPHDAYGEDEKVLKKVCLAHKEGCSVCLLKCPFYKKGYKKIKEKYDKKKKKKELRK